MRKFISLSITSRVIIIAAFTLVVCFFIAAGVYFHIASRALSRSYEPDLIISSPDGQYELVVREFNCIGGTGAELYIREPGQNKWYNSWKEKCIGDAVADDYYCPFVNGDYHVEWERDKVTLFYYKGVPIENRNDRATWQGLVCYEFD